MFKRFAIFGFLLAVCALAVACAGGGSNALLPERPWQPSAVRDAGTASSAAIYLRIPPPPAHARSRFPRFISPGTKLLAIVVSPAKGTPMPVQTFAVTTPSPCATIASSGGEMQCRFLVKVVPGRDAFALATYANPQPTGTPLSEIVTAQETIPTPGPKGAVPPLGFTLQGVPYTVTFAFANPAFAQYEDAAATPIGTKASLPFSAHVYDAAGYEIVERVPAPGHTAYPYFKSFTISTSASALALKNGTQSGPKLTIAGPSDLGNLAAVYDGSIAFNGNAPIDAYGILASLTHRAALPAHLHLNAAYSGVAVVGLESSAVGYSLGTNFSTPFPEGISIDPKQQLFYAIRITHATTLLRPHFPPTSTSGAFGLFSTQSLSNVASMQLSVIPSFPFASPYGGYWFSDSNQRKFLCYPAISNTTTLGANISQSAIVPGNANANGLTADSKGNLWFTIDGNGGSPSYAYEWAIGAVPESATTPCTQAGTSWSQVGTENFLPDGIAPVPAASAAYAGTNGLSQLVVANAGAQPQASLAPVTDAVYGVSSNASAAYALSNSTLYEILPSNALLSLMSVPGASLSAATMSAAPNGTLFATNTRTFGLGAIALIDSSGKKTQYVAPPGLPLGSQCSGTAFDAKSLPWTVCSDLQSSAWVERIVPTAVWGVFPGDNLSLTLSCSITFGMGIVETGFPGSGPFTATSSNPAVISNGSQVSGNWFSFSIPPSGQPINGSSIVTISDAKGRSERVKVSTAYSTTGFCNT